ncbi:MAG TPA: autorepressor SdpR family transcription factor [Gemmatimonadaceae bacterium]|jgi:DNA-binding transcriptional ArsR family regulator
MDAAFKALADPTRREIVRLLRKRSHTSGEIAGQFKSSWPTVSRHLAVLRDAGLIISERDGQMIRYELNMTVLDDVVSHVLAWASPRRAK